MNEAERDWYTSTVEDLETLGINVLWFDAEQELATKTNRTANEIAETIIELHHESSSTFKLAEEYLANSYEGFITTITGEYCRKLRAKYEKLTEEEQPIIENIDL